jgi:hypothetical protein
VRVRCARSAGLPHFLLPYLMEFFRHGLHLRVNTAGTTLTPWRAP